MPSYRIEIADAHAHLFRVTLRLERPDAEQVLSLPVWIPGSYLVREFARHLSNLQASQGRRAVALEQRDKCTWVARCQGSGALTVSYLVYAFDTSVRTAYLDTRRGFFNGTSVFLRVHGREREAQQVTIAGLPREWSVATALPVARGVASKSGTTRAARTAWQFEAPDYDELVDHPVELGSFWRGSFKACGVPHEFVVSGAWPDFDGERLLADTKRICEEQIRLWHGSARPPFKRYVFLLNAVDDGYGGLEHRASTALICARRDLPRRAAPKSATATPENEAEAKKKAAPGDSYVTLLGLISHEYFHTWNVKRLKPAEFAAYDYTAENYTRMLWFFEGFTSYYDDLVLRRCGLIDDARYGLLLGKTITQVLGTPGRQVQSVAEASFDAWIKYYRSDENTANATVSYYTKGSLVGLALDLTLRQHGGTLDGLMRRLWALGRPITEADVRAAARAEAGRSLDAEIDAWVHGRDDLPLEPLLRGVGYKWHAARPTAAQALGVRLGEAGGSIKVQAVMRGSLAERTGLSAGDEWLALDGWRLRKPDDLNALRDDGRAQTALVARDQRLVTLTLAAAQPGAGAGGAVTVTPDGSASEAARKAREAWFASAG